MVDADHIEQVPRRFQTAKPPFIAGLLHFIPVVQRVSPQLSVLGEIVRRDACHGGGHQVLIQLEQFRIGPHIGGIQRHVDGHIPDEGDPLLRGIFPQLVPLGIEQVLYINVEIHVPAQHVAVAVQHVRISVPAVGMADLLRPLIPGFSLKMVFQRHVQGIVPQPGVIFLAEVRDLRQIPFPALFKGLAEDGIPPLVDLAVIHVGGVRPPVDPVQFLLFHQTVLCQHLQVDEIGVAGIGGKGGIGGIPVSGGSQRQQLPPGLTGVVEKIDKLVGLPAECPDPVGRRDAGDGKKDPG